MNSIKLLLGGLLFFSSLWYGCTDEPIAPIPPDPVVYMNVTDMWPAANATGITCCVEPYYEFSHELNGEAPLIYVIRQSDGAEVDFELIKVNAKKYKLKFAQELDPLATYERRLLEAIGKNNEVLLNLPIVATFETDTVTLSPLVLSAVSPLPNGQIPHTTDTLHYRADLDLDASTVAPAYTLTDVTHSTSVYPVVTVSGQDIYVLVPGLLDPACDYSAGFDADIIRGANGERLASPFTPAFSVAALQPLEVVSIEPANGASVVNLDIVSITMSFDVDETTVSAVSISQDSVRVVVVPNDISVDGPRIDLDVAGLLAEDVSYIVEIDTSLSGINGEKMSEPFASGFYMAIANPWSFGEHWKFVSICSDGNGSMYASGSWLPSYTQRDTALICQFTGNGKLGWSKKIVPGSATSASLIAYSGTILFNVLMTNLSPFGPGDINLQARSISNGDLINEWNVASSFSIVQNGLVAQGEDVYIAYGNGFNSYIEHFNLSGEHHTYQLPNKAITSIYIDQDYVYAGGVETNGLFAAKFTSTLTNLWYEVREPYEATHGGFITVANGTVVVLGSSGDGSFEEFVMHKYTLEGTALPEILLPAFEIGPVSKVITVNDLLYKSVNIVKMDTEGNYQVLYNYASASNITYDANRQWLFILSFDAEKLIAFDLAGNPTN